MIIPYSNAVSCISVGKNCDSIENTFEVAYCRETLQILQLMNRQSNLAFVTSNLKGTAD